MKTAKLIVKIEYDDKVTDPESVASALDTLMETAMSIPEVLDEYGNPRVGPFFVAPAPSRTSRASRDRHRRSEGRRT
jgi:hypothetical protein